MRRQNPLLSKFFSGHHVVDYVMVKGFTRVMYLLLIRNWCSALWNKCVFILLAGFCLEATAHFEAINNFVFVTFKLQGAISLTRFLEMFLGCCGMLSDIWFCVKSSFFLECYGLLVS